jgi:hypothetical protein
VLIQKTNHRGILFFELALMLVSKGSMPTMCTRSNQCWFSPIAIEISTGLTPTIVCCQIKKYHAHPSKIHLIMHYGIKRKTTNQLGTKKFESFCNKKKVNTQLVEGGANCLLHV